MSRIGRVERVTKESKVVVEIDLDGTGQTDIATGVPFFDHMLDSLGKHGAFDLTVHAAGDVELDAHHTVEDTAIVLGQALRQALGDKRGIRRYGCAYLPMDETLARVVVDFSGRPFLAYKAPEGVASIGAFSFTLLEEFLRAFSIHAGINLHVEILYGRDAHHMCEAVFKGLAKAVDQACQLDPRVEGIPSTKGTL